MTDAPISLRDYLDERHVAVMAVLARIEVRQEIEGARLAKAEKAIAVLSVVYTLGAAVIGWLVMEVGKRP